MTNPKLRASILIVSDTAHQDPSTDKAGAVLEDAFTRDGGDQWSVEDKCIVPDAVLSIQRKIAEWSDGEKFMNLIVTTGGTGFATRDLTPEAVSPLIHKHAPGLVHGMLASSLEITPFAMMSRPIAGVRNKSLVITLPGSPKGAKENLLAVLKLIPHACMQAAGVDSRALHSGGVKALEQEAGVASTSKSKHRHQHDHNHTHGHGRHAIPKAHTNPEERPRSNDPRQGATHRYRESPYPMISVAEATRLVLEKSPVPIPFEASVHGSVVGHVLAEDVQATEAVPAYRASIVDGYAISISEDTISNGVRVSNDVKGLYHVASVSHAAPGDTPALEGRQVARITTGAPLPQGATAVVMVEDTIISRMTEDGQEEQEIEILTNDIKAGENVREVGSDIEVGEVILRRGEEITAVGGELGLLASVGKAKVMVYKKPIIGVLSTGDEIIQHDRPGNLRLGEVRDCNRPTVMAAVRGWGFEVVDLGIAKDTPGALEATLRDAMRRVSVIITTGGVSMGELDLLKPTIERSLGGVIHFGRVAMKPGKPTTFATVPFKNNDGDHESRLIFSLPGNPASAIVTLHLFVLPSLHHSSGVNPPGLPRVWATLDEDFRLDKQRAEFHRATVTTGKYGFLHAISTGGQRSSKIGSMKGANALLCLPAREGLMKEGERAEALMIGSLLGM